MHLSMDYGYENVSREKNYLGQSGISISQQSTLFYPILG